MKPKIRSVISIILCGFWVNMSEFYRNNVLLKTHWVDHYRSLGITFPSEPVNGLMWMLWGFLYAFSIFLMSRRFNLLQTAIFSWLMAFVLMWIVIWNLSVLPLTILAYAVPLSLLEAFIGSYICVKIAPAKQEDRTACLSGS